MRATVYPLTKNWEWKEHVPDGDTTNDTGAERRSSWTEALHFPSEIHVELKDAGIIVDPYLGFNEHKVQCESDPPFGAYNWMLTTFLLGVGEREWLYRCRFSSPIIDTSKSTLSSFLRFEGLDTICDVLLVLC